MSSSTNNSTGSAVLSRFLWYLSSILPSRRREQAEFEHAVEILRRKIPDAEFDQDPSKLLVLTSRTEPPTAVLRAQSALGPYAIDTIRDFLSSIKKLDDIGHWISSGGRPFPNECLVRTYHQPFFRFKYRVRYDDIPKEFRAKTDRLGEFYWILRILLESYLKYLRSTPHVHYNKNAEEIIEDIHRQLQSEKDVVRIMRGDKFRQRIGSKLARQKQLDLIDLVLERHLRVMVNLSLSAVNEWIIQKSKTGSSAEFFYSGELHQEVKGSLELLSFMVDIRAETIENSLWKHIHS